MAVGWAKQRCCVSSFEGNFDRFLVGFGEFDWCFKGGNPKRAILVGDSTTRPKRNYSKAHI